MASAQTAAKNKSVNVPAPKAAPKPRAKKNAHPAEEVSKKLEPATTETHEITEEQRQADRRADDRVKVDAMAQFVNQSQNGNVPPAAVNTREAEFKEKMAALQAEYGVTAKVTVKPAKADKQQMNGVTRPGADTACGKIWAVADEISRLTHGVAAIASVKEHPAMAGVNDHTIKTQYAKWRKYNGVTGRLPKIHAVHQVQGEYDAAMPHPANTAPPEPKAE